QWHMHQSLEPWLTPPKNLLSRRSPANGCLLADDLTPPESGQPPLVAYTLLLLQLLLHATHHIVRRRVAPDSQHLAADRYIRHRRRNRPQKSGCFYGRSVLGQN